MEYPSYINLVLKTTYLSHLLGSGVSWRRFEKILNRIENLVEDFRNVNIVGYLMNTCWTSTFDYTTFESNRYYFEFPFITDITIFLSALTIPQLILSIIAHC